MKIVDIGCEDFAQAARNRGMIASKANIVGYVEIESLLRGWPMHKPLPPSIPQGRLPTVGKGEARRHGIYEIEGYYE